MSRKHVECLICHTYLCYSPENDIELLQHLNKKHYGIDFLRHLSEKNLGRKPPESENCGCSSDSPSISSSDSDTPRPNSTPRYFHYKEQKEKAPRSGSSSPPILRSCGCVRKSKSADYATWKKRTEFFQECFCAPPKTPPETLNTSNEVKKSPAPATSHSFGVGDEAVADEGSKEAEATTSAVQSKAETGSTKKATREQDTDFNEGTSKEIKPSKVIRSDDAKVRTVSATRPFKELVADFNEKENKELKASKVTSDDAKSRSVSPKKSTRERVTDLSDSESKKSVAPTKRVTISDDSKQHAARTVSTALSTRSGDIKRKSPTRPATSDTSISTPSKNTPTDTERPSIMRKLLPQATKEELDGKLERNRERINDK